MGPATEKVDLSTTQSDIAVLQEKGFLLEKVIGEGSYAKVIKSPNLSEFFGLMKCLKSVFRGICRFTKRRT